MFVTFEALSINRGAQTVVRALFLVRRKKLRTKDAPCGAALHFPLNAKFY